MAIYLHDIPLDQARNVFRQSLEEHGVGKLLGIEQIPLDEDAIGRVIAEPIWARISSPHYHASAMDGFATKSSDTVDASVTTPVTLVSPDQIKYMDTGDPIPDWADCVIPIENVESLDDKGLQAENSRAPAKIRIRASMVPWSHIRPVGEDIVASQLVLPAGHTIRAIDLGALAACGCVSLPVARKPIVGIIPTGTELISVGVEPKSGDIIEYNSMVLSGHIRTWGGNSVRYPITPDVFAQIRERVQFAADQSDLVLLNAGSSAGSEDFSARVVEELGILLVHGVAVRPGHPVILGMIKRTNPVYGGPTHTPIIGVPGYPVSAALTNEIFVQPLMDVWLGRSPNQPVEIDASITRKVSSPAGDDDYLRVVVGKVAGKTLAAPVARGAGVITSLVRADGIVVIPAGSQGLEAGSPVKVRLYRSPTELDQTILAIGSHDMTLDILAQFLSPLGRRLTSANTGSVGGLVALQRNETHFAGTHLLDPESGEYNLSAIHRYLPGIPVVLTHWVGRMQGLMVKKGNPKAIKDLGDLISPDITFVNRQRGAGTRVLLDYHLSRLGIAQESILGYNQEEYTHLAVAVAIASGRADCGLGISAAAQALDLDFIPLYWEQYDLVFRLESMDLPLLKPLFDLMNDQKFRNAIMALPGYNVAEMGKKFTVGE